VNDPQRILVFNSLVFLAGNGESPSSVAEAFIPDICRVPGETPIMTSTRSQATATKSEAFPETSRVNQQR
jgi:hypothetical protein